MKKHRRPQHMIGAVILLVAAFGLTSCNRLENETQSGSLLTVETITGLDSAGGEGNFIQSDVLYVDSTTGATALRADSATVIFTASTLDPAPLLGTSQYNDIQVTRYVVTYIRADGRNVQGVDVPYAFEGGLSVLVRIGVSTTASFIIVRDVAKQEPPLFNLRAGFAGDILNVTARVDFYGRDLANKTVKATGMIPITFANYGN